MVSDVLSDAVEGLRHYLKEPTYRETYVGDVRRRIEVLVKDMETLRIELDTPPK